MRAGSVCNNDVFRGQRIRVSRRAKKPRDAVKEDSAVEGLAASARLIEAVAVLSK